MVRFAAALRAVRAARSRARQEVAEVRAEGESRIEAFRRDQAERRRVAREAASSENIERGRQKLRQELADRGIPTRPDANVGEMAALLAAIKAREKAANIAGRKAGIFGRRAAEVVAGLPEFVATTAFAAKEIVVQPRKAIQTLRSERGRQAVKETAKEQLVAQGAQFVGDPLAGKAGTAAGFLLLGGAGRLARGAGRGLKTGGRGIGEAARIAREAPKGAKIDVLSREAKRTVRKKVTVKERIGRGEPEPTTIAEAQQRTTLREAKRLVMRGKELETAQVQKTGRGTLIGEKQGFVEKRIRGAGIDVDVLRSAETVETNFPLRVETRKTGLKSRGRGGRGISQKERIIGEDPLTATEKGVRPTERVRTVKEVRGKEGEFRLEGLEARTTLEPGGELVSSELTGVVRSPARGGLQGFVEQERGTVPRAELAERTRAVQRSKGRVREEPFNLQDEINRLFENPREVLREAKKTRLKTPRELARESMKFRRPSPMEAAVGLAGVLGGRRKTGPTMDLTSRTIQPPVTIPRQRFQIPPRSTTTQDPLTRMLLPVARGADTVPIVTQAQAQAQKQKTAAAAKLKLGVPALFKPPSPPRPEGRTQPRKGRLPPPHPRRGRARGADRREEAPPPKGKESHPPPL